jgi:hypothetical protein
MKRLIVLYLFSYACFAHAMSPPAERPDTPPVPLTRIIAKAWVEAKTVDKTAYPAEAKFEYASMAPQPNEFTRDHWVITFFRPKGPVSKEGFPDIVVLVTWDGEKSIISKK